MAHDLWNPLGLWCWHGFPLPLSYVIPIFTCDENIVVHLSLNWDSSGLGEGLSVLTNMDNEPHLPKYVVKSCHSQMDSPPLLQVTLAWVGLMKWQGKSTVGGPCTHGSNLL